MWTTAARVNPPPARATENSLKPVQSPQGNSSLRLVVAPNPCVKRKISEQPPASRTNHRTTCQNPNLGFFILYSLHFLARFAPSRGGSLFTALSGGHDHPPVRDPPDAPQQNPSKRDHIGHFGKHARSQQGHGLREHVAGVSELFKRNAREQQHRCSPHFAEAVNVFHILAGIVANALLRFGDEIVALAELCGPGWTDLSACGLLACGDAIRTHSALPYLREQLAPFIFGDTERTGQHAVAAPHAAAFVINHRPGGRLAKSCHGASRSASRILAIHTQAPHELIAFGEDGGVFVIRLLLFGRDGVVVGQFVFSGAGDLTLLATDTHGRVIEQSLTHGNFSWLLHSGIFVPAERNANETPCRAAAQLGTVWITAVGPAEKSRPGPEC